jgi:hypothetical protein
MIYLRKKQYLFMIFKKKTLYRESSTELNVYFFLVLSVIERLSIKSKRWLICWFVVFHRSLMAILSLICGNIARLNLLTP